MINSAIVRIVDFCARRRWTIAIAGVLLMLGAAAFDAARFSINTDIEGLIFQDLPWRQRELELSKAFPKKGIVVVVKATTPENAEQATNTLAQALSKNPDLFPAVEQFDSGDFFERNGLLFESPADVKKTAAGLTRVQPLIAALASDPKLRGTVALTGEVPMNDDQFSVIRYSAVRDTLTAVFGVLIILWLALRSWKIITAVFFSLMTGLAATAALGLVLVSSFNLISIALFVLFVGLGVDFGIQFSVRYRAERYEHPDLYEALRWAARKAGDPLSLAAAATAVGFFAFLPTSYRGLSELGLIAGCGMLVAFACSIPLVPAMLALLKPPGEPAPVGFRSLAPVDDFLQRHRIPVLVRTFIVVIAR